MAMGLGVRNLLRQPLRAALSLAGIAVASGMLLDMVMLSGGIERSFARLLLGRGYQIRVTAKGTLPFDTEASMSGASAIVRALRADPAVAAAGGVLGASLYGGRSDSLRTLVAYGIEPDAQALYQLDTGADLLPGDDHGLLLSRTAADLLGAAIGDTVRLTARLDPQMAGGRLEHPAVVRGIVRWLYDYRGQRSIGLTLGSLQRLLGPASADRASIIVVKVRDDARVAATAARLRRELPRLEISSVADLVASFRNRMVYFRQLAYILGSVSLLVTVLLVATLLTITVNERLGEIATLRAIGVSRGRIVARIMSEGATLTAAGAAIGVVLGLATARYLDAILTSFPGLPAAFSFFVPRADAIAAAGALLFVTGTLAGLYPAWLAARAPIAATLRAEAT